MYMYVWAHTTGGATLGAGWGGRPSYRRARPIPLDPFFPNTGSEERWSGEPASTSRQRNAAVLEPEGRMGLFFALLSPAEVRGP